MSIRFRCEDCQAKIKVPQGAEGRKVKCPRCGAVHRVPQHAAVSQHDDQREGADSDIDLDSLASAVGDLAGEDDSGGDSFEPSPSAMAQGTDLSDHGSTNEPEYEEEEEDEQDPLAALASMADGAEGEDAEDDTTGFDQDQLLEEDDDEDAAPEQIEDLFDDPHPEPETRPQPAFPSAVTSKGIKPTIPLATPKPRPPSAPASDGDAATGSHHTPHIRPGSPLPQRRAIGLSSRSAPNRPQPRPIPLGDPMAADVSTSAGPPSAFQNMLSLVGWVLRVLGGLATLGAITLTVAPDDSWTMGARLLVLLYGLMVAVVVWALGEIALAVRYLVQRRG